MESRSNVPHFKRKCLKHNNKYIKGYDEIKAMKYIMYLDI